MNSSDPELVGWVSEPNGRGTLGLLTTCLTTIVLCTWVVIHPRVYQSESFATCHKLALLAKTLLAPEFIAVEGLQEWAQCRRMVEECSKYTNGEFKLLHAYYISMLALRYRTPEGNRVVWPNQFTWLLEQGAIDWRRDYASWGLTEKQIRDKNKSDSITKLITLFQVLWFVATCIMRAANALPLSQLESMTLSYIPLFAITYFFWWEKPKDVFAPTVVDLPPMDLEQLIKFESMALSDKFDYVNAQKTYWSIWDLTPRVLEKEEEERESRKATQQTRPGNSQQETPKSPTFGEAEIRGEEGEIKARKDIVVAHWDPYLYNSKTIRALCSLFGASFGALHLACWNTAFPTVAEKWMWRSSAFVSIFSLLAFMHFEKVVLCWNGVITIVQIGSPALYFASRLLMMGEVFVALRAVEKRVYETYDVADYGITL
ncbi:uncharacterized protein DSM5745_09981 [Aspergillus mulundensis]|uniref:Uncharacterized protein n=1 Tax=Aspergillus mulundensis TaxID=1810919 RepID=A0A3D8QSE9_9EURO|nr:Uncharacterized protein DSM5745_09981 [Aspergillus mulundensis]RDW64570.1 Uncharacterized protein DSM5745_09981 [Aspergillus mulundensis]